MASALSRNARILIDLTHLNEKGVWDVARLSDAPLVSTHSNVHAISPQSRNLIEKQLAAIRETGGLVGVSYVGGLIRPDGRGGTIARYAHRPYCLSR
ncbi:membrane dipeptidase [Mesorhizobium sp. M0136]|uniref:membrane dipeptidase n=1 Tax=Mesorhizobium sp. M0136 TaxID=2956890 RepID=UPI00333C9439